MRRKSASRCMFSSWRVRRCTCRGLAIAPWGYRLRGLHSLVLNQFQHGIAELRSLQRFDPRGQVVAVHLPAWLVEAQRAA